MRKQQWMGLIFDVFAGVLTLSGRALQMKTSSIYTNKGRGKEGRN